ncbi:hypothetical protein [Actinoplanes sp. GCM10030250]
MRKRTPGRDLEPRFAPIPGPRKLSRVEETIAAVDVTLTHETNRWEETS